jgi:hypothetical protein
VPGYGESRWAYARSEVGDRRPRGQGAGILETSEMGVEKVLSDADEGLGDGACSSGSSVGCCRLGGWRPWVTT